MFRDVGCDLLVAVCSSLAVGVTALAHFLLLRGKRFPSFFRSAFYSWSETWLYVCMCIALSTPSVSNMVEAVGHSVRPH